MPFVSKRQRRIADRLGEDLSPIQRRLEARHIMPLATACEAYLGRTGGDLDAARLADFLLHGVIEGMKELDRLGHLHRAFSQRYAAAPDDAARQQEILRFAGELGAGWRQLRGDRRAFARWFDRDAIEDRLTTRVGAGEQRLAFLLDRLGRFAASAAAGADDPVRYWGRLDLEGRLAALFAYPGDARLRLAAFYTLSAVLRALPAARQEGAVRDTTLRFIYRSALEGRGDVWVQCEALELLHTLSPESLEKVVRRRLGQPGADSDLFVRRRALRLLGRNMERFAEPLAAARDAAADPSPAVRQVVAELFPLLPSEACAELAEPLILADPEPAVRAASLLGLLPVSRLPERAEGVAALVAKALAGEQEPFVLRVALRVAARGFRDLLDGEPEAAGMAWRERLLPEVERLTHEARQTPVRRWAAAAREELALLGDPLNRSILERLGQLARRIEAGGKARLPADLAALDPDRLGRLLALAARADHGLEVQRTLFGSHLRRGHRFRFRLWRLLHELKHPSPDKRQAHRHTIGRVFYGLTCAPSAILAEQAKTKVPGEPLAIAEEGGWRPYLPLLDQMISALDQGWPTRPLRIYSAEGVTEIRPPGGLFARLWARWSLQRRFVALADLRNWRDGDGDAPNAYIAALRKLGFTIEFQDHTGKEGQALATDGRVRRFFNFAPLPFLEDAARQAEGYFFSVYENTLLHLGLFLAAFGAWFYGHHLYLSHRIRRARGRIPLVVGGWGTRGKSGTERVKAALFNALGYGLVSKTTGCEAMFIHAAPFGRMREMYLFRPYEKATIWEQFNLVLLTARLRSQVFLWECMGLTPAYVFILQRQWMRDDLSTITNTFPDHEDLQGPAGIDLPKVMNNFIPPAGDLITSEEEMRPILLDEARRIGTRVEGVGWLEAGLLAPDIVARFPYDEHPFNIALVVAMAARLGIEEDFVLKETAERVVPDLGVLKTYPLSRIDDRRLEFVMGMSANERFGALGNWTRMGFDKHDLDRDPETWVVALVNNRADRIARSRVFAGILAQDISCDRHILIGNNLAGLLGYIREAWEEWSADLTLWSDGGDSPQQLFERLARKLRIPLSEAQAMGRVEAMARGLDLPPDAARDAWRDGKIPQGLAEGEGFAAAVAALRTGWEEYAELRGRIGEAKTPNPTLLAETKAMLWRRFEEKCVVIEDYHASGNQVIAGIVAATPPGLKARIMGLQNIKGTGLDYVYRWQAWESCYQACEAMESEDLAVAGDGLRILAGFKEYGPLCDRHVRAAVEAARHRPWAQREEFQAALERVIEKVDEAAQAEQSMEAQGGARLPWLTPLIAPLESLADSSDAVTRRKRADRIYRDLVDERIGRDRAALELQRLTKRQKGGWLLELLKR